MSENNSLQQKSNEISQIFKPEHLQKLQMSLVMVEQRMGESLTMDHETMINDIESYFGKKLHPNLIVDAIKDGTMGVHGQVFKITPHIVYSWIQKELEFRVALNGGESLKPWYV